MNLHKASTTIDLTERQRLESLSVFERAAYKNGFKSIAGVDEAGRGPLAGPVVASACILPENYLLPGLNDSKKLSASARQRLYNQILADDRIHVGVGIVPSDEIDRINILQATICAMLDAVKNLKVQPDLLLVDGLKLVHPVIPSEKIIGGDGLSLSIAAASIVAKETRDRLMLEMHERWPMYGFNKHKGYGTQAHLRAMSEHGVCAIHRRSFAPVKALWNEKI